jgi:hypothetical protein
MRHLPVLPARDAIDQITIASPCAVPWDSMRGDERVRFCGHCRQNVYNVVSFTRQEARRLIEAREGRLCVRLLRRDDGTVVTADCWTRLRAARRRGWLEVAAVLVMIGWTQLTAVRFGWQALGRLWKRAPAPCAVGEIPTERLGLRAQAAPADPDELQGLVSGAAIVISHETGEMAPPVVLGKHRPSRELAGRIRR